MRLGSTSSLRCAWAIRFGETLNTRCFMKPAHSGMHEAKGLKKFTYQRVRWFGGDAREFISGRDDEFAWSERKARTPRERVN